MTVPVKLLAFGVLLTTGFALGAQAQTVSTVIVPGPSLASLHQPGPRPSSAGSVVAPQTNHQISQSGNYVGPDPGKGWYPRPEAHIAVVQPSPQYVGPRPN
jgi:hypothetical protein